MEKDNFNLRARELEVVLKISQAVSRTLDLKEILKMACQMTAQALNADRCSIGLLDTKGTYTITHSSYRRLPSYPSIAGEKFIARYYPVITRKLREKKVIQIIRDKPSAFLSMSERRLLKQLNMKVFLAVPIVIQGKPIGAFHLGKVENSSPFSSSDISLCRTIASQIGVAIRNATLVMELRKDHELLEKQSEDLKTRYQQQNLILDISKSLFRTSNLQEVFNLITQKTCKALGLDRCTILQFDPAQKEAIIRSVYHSSRVPRGKDAHDSADLGKKFLIETHPEIYSLLRKKGYLVTEDFSSNPLLPGTRKYVKKLGVKSALAIPFYSGKKISGTLLLSDLRDHHHFTDSEIKFCQTIANLASMSLQNVKLMQNLQEKSSTLQQQAEVLGKQFREQNILLEISKSISRTKDLQQLFDIATETTAKLLNVERSTILFYDREKKVATYKSAYIKGRHRREYADWELRVGQYPTLNDLLKRKVVLSEFDVPDSLFHARDKKYFIKKGVKSLLAVPISLRAGITGIFSIGSHNRRIQFSNSEIKLCKSIAILLSVAIQNAMLIEDLQGKSLTIEQQTETLKKQFREQTILLEISKALSQTLDLRELLKIATKKVVELLGIDRAVAMIIDQKTGNHSIFVHYSRVKDIPELKDFPKNINEFPYLIGKSRTENVYYVYDTEKSSISLREKDYFRKRKIKSVLVLPFVLKGKLLGVISLNSIGEKRMFTDSEIKLGQAIANQLSIAVENANLIEISKKHSAELEKLSLQIINAQEEERKNLAGRLHDVVGQDLTALQLDLKMSKHEIPVQFAQTRARLEEEEKLARQTLENVRNLTMDLRPPILDDFGLASAIRWYVDGFSRRTNIKVISEIQELVDCKLPPEFETAIYRAIQECLTNVAKHSVASRVKISLDKRNEHLQLIVRDNGIGFEPGIFHFTNGFGLFRLKEKTELLGGKFSLSSRKGKGTKVVILFPRKQKEK